MKTKHFFLYAFVLLSLNGCYETSFYSNWTARTDEPLIDTIEFVIKNKKSEIVASIYKGRSDSIPDFDFHLEQNYISIPIIPFFYWVEFQRSNAPYKLQVRIGNNKIYQSLDSINYTLYDSLNTKHYDGSLKYDSELTVSPDYSSYLQSFSPYTIDIKLSKKDIIYGDFDLFFTDINNNPIVQRIKKIKFNYEKNRQTMIIINS
jgi:hypothetical protein